jgi:hypothetical protein
MNISNFFAIISGLKKISEGGGSSSVLGSSRPQLVPEASIAPLSSVINGFTQKLSQTSIVL